MNKFVVAITGALASGLALGATAAKAQSWGYDLYQADRSYQKSDRYNDRAHAEQQAARDAARYGDYGAADHFARAASHDHHQAQKSARWAHHEDHVAGWDYWHGGWGY